MVPSTALVVREDGNVVQAVAEQDASLLSSTIDVSIESHIMAFAAERSRAQDTVEAIRL